MSYGRPVQVIAVTGGKGGVGKSNISVNLSIALAELHRRVVLLDADLGLANVDVLLGLKAQYNLADVLSGERRLPEIMISGPSGVDIVPAASGVQQMATLGDQEHAALIRAFSDIADNLDVLVIDTAAGISDSVVSFVRAANEILVVVCDEPSSITDAYALIKLMNTEYGTFRFRVVANMTRNNQEGSKLFAKLNAVCQRFLDVSLQYIGHIPFDENVRKAVQKQTPILEYAPRSKAAQAIRTLAQKVDELPLPNNPRGHLEFFVEKLLNVANSGF
ncbi:MinD/ParA family protein [Pseudoteredinibacter isoporae]|uniref:Flagellar biosynthesis protein FlhG n=1 Tax=Pseudoteredinibacter isoporae TaxID=570281 RepID=A0A7X0MX86_9GAMM|nr:MinD/ParA family protein [Pseudoteredinibacter isoporae]MBB6523456.1 flagellar biosynthesis protein FlhG [Pseudoteredinibacter isoporae]NHO88965.1 MinD/ParA family protein [Pseudoteredinibacter isoporae]NIB24327.1 MinD/ParA family protein [Pseudoteredinibacter isoporae]